MARAARRRCSCSVSPSIVGMWIVFMFSIILSGYAQKARPLFKGQACFINCLAVAIKTYGLTQGGLAPVVSAGTTGTSGAGGAGGTTGTSGAAGATGTAGTAG